MRKYKKIFKKPTGKAKKKQSFQEKFFEITRYSYIIFLENLTPSLLSVIHFLYRTQVYAYLGAGYHQGFLTSPDPYYEAPYGISCVAGAEITLARFVLSYDYKPAFNLYGGEHSWYNQSALTVRYVFVKQNAFQKMMKKRERKKKKKKRADKRKELFND